MEITATWVTLWTEQETEQLKRATLAVRDRVEKLSTAGAADLIALELEARGVQALCENPYACAIAVDLNRALRESGTRRWEVYVGGNGTVEIQDAVNYTPTAQVTYSDDEVDLAGWVHPLNAFISKFDCKDYPNLILKEEL